ncbi:arsenate reductase ArsC [Permianibacter aggregans]|uniref:Protein tyrosine phosphatase n=1 Tax=Permianibacter aggregans TaxID=1510150 RepID=A0A4R6UP43_9GAMM|nr:arsenate reductase ArsC [Permianibacter aggregans]QGX38144.1 arsenate reductase ArsC [Permianibacter aggregans]QGX38153.1 arsenate reductase ArsC [Permianibacter aggregans]TDQ45004.1 protein tyrosine phosphatase [Permianibacter aggregans]
MKRKVLFVCTENAARSPMAEAILRQLVGDQFEAFSAGHQPTQLHPEALHALRELDIDTSGLSSKSLSSFIGTHFDFVITLCDKAKQECDTLPGAHERIAWDFEDPRTSAETMPYLRTAKALRERIKLFVLVQTRKS